MPTFPSRRYVRGDRFAVDSATGHQLRWGIPSGGGSPRWLLVGGSVVEAISSAPWRFRGLDEPVEASNGILPLPEGTTIVLGNRVLVLRNGEPVDVGTLMRHEED